MSDPYPLHHGGIVGPVPDPEEGMLLEAMVESTTMTASSLMVSVDYLDLVEQVGQEEAWVVLGKLKDLLG
jgi:hypothetical protein